MKETSSNLTKPVEQVTFEPSEYYKNAHGMIEPAQPVIKPQIKPLTIKPIKLTDKLLMTYLWWQLWVGLVFTAIGLFIGGGGGFVLLFSVPMTVISIISLTLIKSSRR